MESAAEDIIYRSVQEKRLWDDIAGKEIKYITEYMPNTHRLGQGIKMVASTKESKKALCHLQFRLFTQYLRNDHTLWSVFQRSAGTNLSLYQRLSCFFMYLCTIMVTTGTFYGVEQSNMVQDALASFIISLFSTVPVLIIRKIFEKSKPKEVISEKHNLDELVRKSSSLSTHKDNNEDVIKEGGMEITSNQEWNVRKIMSEGGGNVTTAMFSNEMNKIVDGEDINAKIIAVSELRKYLFKTMFSLPSYFKTLSWIFLII